MTNNTKSKNLKHRQPVVSSNQESNEEETRPLDPNKKNSTGNNSNRFQIASETSFISSISNSINNNNNTTSTSYSSSSRGVASRFRRRMNPIKLVFIEIFTYSTARSASIFSIKVGLAYRAVQALVLGYIIGWELIHNRAYQVRDTVSSVVTSKVKGQGFVASNETLPRNYDKRDVEYYRQLFSFERPLDYKILDTADYIIPPNEYNSLFIMTNFIRTHQTQGFCDEEFGKYKAGCKEDKDCPPFGHINPVWNGIPTGKCVNSSVMPGEKTCEIKAWCPSENDNYRFEDNIIRNVVNYTLFIKNDIEFKKFNQKHRNIEQNVTNKFIATCSYHEDDEPLCPVFQLGTILSMAEANETERYLMLLKGGVIQIEIVWNCDFDFQTTCLPRYHFHRFDLPFHETRTASGFNFRFADRFIAEGKEHRILYKAFGLRLIITVSGTAGKFNIVPLMITIGTGVGLMSISVLIADCVMLYCTKDKKTFKRMKSMRIDKDEILQPDLSNLEIVRV